MPVDVSQPIYLRGAWGSPRTGNGGRTGDGPGTADRAPFYDPRLPKKKTWPGGDGTCGGTDKALFGIGFR